MKFSSVAIGKLSWQNLLNMSSSNERPIFQEKTKLTLPDKPPEPVHFFYEDFDR